MYIIAPLLVAGIAHAPVIKRDLLPSLARPLDFGATYRGTRVFGENKTWRGLLLMSTVCVLVTYVQSELDSIGAFRDLSVVDYSGTRWLALGLALGLAYSLSELPNSFAKRRLGIPPGGVARTRAIGQYVVDQADSVVGGTLVLLLFLGPDWATLGLVFVLGFCLHVGVDQLFVLFSVKRRVPLATARVGGSTT